MSPKDFMKELCAPFLRHDIGWVLRCRPPSFFIDFLAVVVAGEACFDLAHLSLHISWYIGPKFLLRFRSWRAWWDLAEYLSQVLLNHLCVTQLPCRLLLVRCHILAVCHLFDQNQSFAPVYRWNSLFDSIRVCFCARLGEHVVWHAVLLVGTDYRHEQVVCRAFVHFSVVNYFLNFI